jgi:predicted peptidase
MYRYFFLYFFVIFIYSQNIDTIKNDFYLNSKRLPYVFLKIGKNLSNKKKYPLILFLHGAGERGDQNIEQLTVAIPVLVKTIISSKNYPCFILIPQCPKNQKWVNTDWFKTSHIMEKNMTWPLEATIMLLDSIVKNFYLIDSSKIYVTGISMGGFGTWELIQRFPNKFAAAVPICGGGDTTNAKLISNTAIWAFHGKMDKVVKVSRTIDMIKVINKEKKRAKMTIFENEGHSCWNTVYKNSRTIEWLFRQKLYNE